MGWKREGATRDDAGLRHGVSDGMKLPPSLSAISAARPVRADILSAQRRAEKLAPVRVGCRRSKSHLERRRTIVDPGRPDRGRAGD